MECRVIPAFFVHREIIDFMKFILGKKIGMSQIFNGNGSIVPITLIEAGPCYVTQIKTKDKDKYEAVQIGFERLKEKQVKKPQKNKPFRYLREFRIHTDGLITLKEEEKEDGKKGLKVGDEINVSIFQEGDKVKISGLSKGKGFAGVVKRWGFKGKKSKTHGTKHEIRTAGSVGTSFPQRVVKGRKMAGRMGSERVTIKNLTVVKIEPENNLLAVKGAVPGRKGTLLEIRDDF